MEEFRVTVPRTAHRISRYLTADDLAASLAYDVRTGLSAMPKALPPKYFYDARGSELFEEITRLPEYYPTRTEETILRAGAEEMVHRSGADTLVELGSGSSTKTRLLLDAMRANGRLRRYVPVDVSESALQGAMDALGADYPTLDMHGVVADFERHLELLPRAGTRLVAFLGGTIGNLPPGTRARFLAAIRAGLAPGDRLLLGTDLVKSPDRLVRAYDDEAGVTAEFNRNVLHVVNRELDADFVPEAYEHVAIWDAEHEWIEMRLRSTSKQTVRIARLDLEVRFAAGEELRTEISAKFRREGVAAELAAAGLDLDAWWTDPAGDFALSLSAPATGSRRT
jgi:L-histidine Nalpha-methyltransferase